MTNETKVFRGTSRTLEASGGSITNNSVVQADDASYDTDVNGGGYPDGEFFLTCAFGTAPTEGTTIALYAQPLAIDGANNSLTPEATRPTQFVGVFVVDNTTSTQYLQIQGIFARDLPKSANYWLHNNGTGQTMSSGWKLVITPRTKGPA